MINQSMCVIVLCACTLSTGNLAYLFAQEDKVISPVTAIESIGKGTVVVEMTVQASKNRLEKRGIFFLDSDADFASPKNLGIAVSENAINQLKKRIDSADMEKFFIGKEIRVTGAVMRFEQRPYITVLDAKQIEILLKK
jgi:DNA/RNA endonuclease YhcR with UshA esterase domain